VVVIWRSITHTGVSSEAAWTNAGAEADTAKANARVRRLSGSLLTRGSLFEDNVVAAEKPTPVPSAAVPDLVVARDRTDMLRCTDLLRNHDLGIHGIPDLIAVERGAYAPIEIKQHRLMTRLDVLEWWQIGVTIVDVLWTAAGVKDLCARFLLRRDHGIVRVKVARARIGD
jgi:hypothetical protein